MFCRKCGNKLADDDAFCSKCGAKVTDNSPPPTPPITDNKPAAARPPSTVKKWLKHPLVRAILYLIGFLLITIIIYAMFPQPKISVAQFVTNPRGLTSVFGSYLGIAMASYLFFLPLLFRLSDLGIMPKIFIVDCFFVIMFVYEFGNFLFGREYFSREIMPPISFGALILGIIIRIFTSPKKK